MENNLLQQEYENLPKQIKLEEEANKKRYRRENNKSRTKKKERCII